MLPESVRGIARVGDSRLERQIAEAAFNVCNRHPQTSSLATSHDR